MVNSIIGMALTPTRNSYRDLEEIQQAQQKEHRKNNAKTAFGVGLAVGLPTAAGYAVYKNPDKAEALISKYGNKVDVIVNKGKKVVNNIFNKGNQKVTAEKITSQMPKNISNIEEYVKEAAKKIEQEIANGKIKLGTFNLKGLKTKLADLFSDPKKLSEKLKQLIEDGKISIASKNTKFGDLLKDPKKAVKYVVEKLNNAKFNFDKLKINPQKFEELAVPKGGILSKAKSLVCGVVDKIKGTKAYETVSKAVKDFMSKPNATKGKVALIVAGAALALSTVINLVRNHDYEAGKIDQKYEDMKRNNPIINAQTGEIISKERYEEMMNTYLK